MKDQSMIEIKKLRDNAIIPKRATNGSAAYDLHACIDESMILAPNTVSFIPSGLAIYTKRNNVAIQILPRSGLGAKHGIVLGNLVGLIDSDYQGEIMITAWNRSLKPYTLEPQERVAQMIFIPVLHFDFKEVNEFSNETNRGSGGFGSSGKL